MLARVAGGRRCVPSGNEVEPRPNVVSAAAGRLERGAPLASVSARLPLCTLVLVTPCCDKLTVVIVNE